MKDRVENLSQAADNAKARIERAIKVLNDMIWDSDEKDRLVGKIDGLKLALSYIKEEERLAGDE